MTKKANIRTFWSVIFPVVACGVPTVGAGDQRPDYTTPIVNKAIAALGDSQTQAKYKGVTCDVRFKIKEDHEPEFSFKWFVLGNDKFRAEVSITDPRSQQNAILIRNGKKFWLTDYQETEEVSGKELADFLVVLNSVWLVQKPGNLFGKEFKLSPLGELKIQDRDAVGLRVEQEGSRDISLYFDKETGAPLRSEFSMPKPANGKEDTQISFTFADPKDFGGIKQFTKVIVHQDQQEVTTVELSNFRFHETLDADQFAKPGK